MSSLASSDTFAPRGSVARGFTSNSDSFDPWCLYFDWEEELLVYPDNSTLHFEGRVLCVDREKVITVNDMNLEIFSIQDLAKKEIKSKYSCTVGEPRTIDYFPKVHSTFAEVGGDYPARLFTPPEDFVVERIIVNDTIADASLIEVGKKDGEAKCLFESEREMAFCCNPDTFFSYEVDGIETFSISTEKSTAIPGANSNPFTLSGMFPLPVSGWVGELRRDGNNFSLTALNVGGDRKVIPVSKDHKPSWILSDFTTIVTTTHFESPEDFHETVYVDVSTDGKQGKKIKDLRETKVSEFCPPCWFLSGGEKLKIWNINDPTTSREFDIPSSTIITLTTDVVSLFLNDSSLVFDVRKGEVLRKFPNMNITKLIPLRYTKEWKNFAIGKLEEFIGSVPSAVLGVLAGFL